VGENETPLTYKDSGVDIDAMNHAIQLMKEHVRSTYTPGVASDVGAFGSLFALNPGDPESALLCASVDSVGTKVKIAFATGIHNTIGWDLVNHCCNDILCQGARPLFFLDYFGTGNLSPEVAAQVVEGLAAGCRENGIALIGGETAELPGIYREGEYDLAGFVLGIAEQRSLLAARLVRAGDVLVGLASNGLHTNGYSLALAALVERKHLKFDQFIDRLGATLGEALLEVHTSYRRAVDAVRDAVGVKAIAHITGGGFFDNVARVLPEGLEACIDKGAWEVPELFKLIREAAGIDDREAYRVFNMGVGMVLVVASGNGAKAVEAANDADCRAFVIGEVREGAGGVILV